MTLPPRPVIQSLSTTDPETCPVGLACYQDKVQSLTPSAPVDGVRSWGLGFCELPKLKLPLKSGLVGPKPQSLTPYGCSQSLTPYGCSECGILAPARGPPDHPCLDGDGVEFHGAAAMLIVGTLGIAVGSRALAARRWLPGDVS